MKAVLIIYVIQYTIYFTFEYIIFRSYHHWCSKVAMSINGKISKREEYKDRLSQGVFDRSEGGGPILSSFRFNDH